MLTPEDAVQQFWYLATPYSKYPYGKDEAYDQALRAAAECFKEGILVFSPIAHTHPIAIMGNIEGSYDTWRRFDEAMMAASVGMIVVEMDGWRASDGIEAEIEWCERHGKPIIYRDKPC